LLGLRKLNPQQIKEIEPHAAGISAIHVPQEGIVDYPGVCEKLGELIRNAGGEIKLNARVLKIVSGGGGQLIETSAGTFRAKFVVTCGGLHADRLVRASGQKSSAKVIPFRGEYFKIKKERQFLVRNLIYPVPDPRFPFLGVHFTRLIHGGIEAGPNAVLAFAREGYRKTDFSARDLADALTYIGFLRFLRRYPSVAWYELRRSFSRRLFCRSLQRLVPEVQPDDLDVGGSGVRAQAISPAGEVVQEFCLIARPNALHVLNAPSPAATASLAIGAEIASMVEKGAA